MERIGIVASKIAKGNIILYNFLVLLMTFLFSFLVFFICGTAIFIVLVVLDNLNKMRNAPASPEIFYSVARICALGLSVVIGIFAIFALGRNIKLKK